MLTVTTNKTNYAVGETVVITLTLTNDTGTTQTYNFSSSQRYDVIIGRGGNKVWQWSDGRFFAQMMGSETLQPGESRVYTVEWNQTNSAGNQVPTGTYTVVGQITSYNMPEQDTTTITIS